MKLTGVDPGTYPLRVHLITSVPDHRTAVLQDTFGTLGWAVTSSNRLRTGAEVTLVPYVRDLAALRTVVGLSPVVALLGDRERINGRVRRLLRQADVVALTPRTATRMTTIPRVPLVRLDTSEGPLWADEVAQVVFRAHAFRPQRRS